VALPFSVVVIATVSWSTATCTTVRWAKLRSFGLWSLRYYRTASSLAWPRFGFSTPPSPPATS
jgi:hypothetical protein